MSKAPRGGEHEVQSITSVPESLDSDQARRAKQYLIQMGIRVVCFLGAVVALTTGHPWLGWALAAGAVILPYTAVIFVNAPNRRAGEAQPYVAQPTLLDQAQDPGSKPDDRKPEHRSPEPQHTNHAPDRRPSSDTSGDSEHTVIDGDALLADVHDEPVEKKN